MRHSVPSPPVAIVSCHLEQPLRDAAWARFDELQRRRPGGFDVIALMRPPDAGYDEDVERWLTRARTTAARGPFGLHTHWTSPSHARPTGGDPAARVEQEVAWMRSQELEPQYFCGGGWYTDAAVERAVRELGLVDCTERNGVPHPGVLPTTHSLGQLARAVMGPLPAYVHAYFHDYDLLDTKRRLALVTALTLLGRRRPPGDALALAR
jgi:hypothetical protein